MDVLSQKVLQLNRHYEPDAVIGVKRALCLVFRGAARIEQPDPDPTHGVHTANYVYLVPSVIVLTDYYNLRKLRQTSKKHRFHIFVRDKFRCQYCGKKLPPFELTLDHIMPESRQGSNEPENLATACNPCNQRKANRTPDEARMPLLATPSALRYGLDQALLYHHAETRPEWEPYLYRGTHKTA